MSIWSRRDERIAQKAADVTSAAVVDQLTHGGTFSYTPDGTVSFLQLFGQSYEKLYRTQSAFRSVVDFLSRNIGAIHIKLIQEQADGSRRARPDDSAQQILEHPLPGVSYSQLMRAIVADKAIYDAYAVWKIRENFFPKPNAQGFVTNSGPVVNLVRIPIPYISIKKASLTGPVEFQLTAGDQIRIRAEDVIWGNGYSPSSNVQGVPHAETLRQILAEEWAAAKNQENQWKRGAHGNTVFTQDPAVPGLDIVAAANFKTEWQARYGGVQAKNAGEIPLLPAGIKPEDVVLDAQSSQYLATRMLAREEVCREFGFNPALLGITPSNFSSADLFHQMLYQDTLAPWCVSIQEDFEEQLLTEFHDVDEGYAYDFNMNAKMQGSFLEQAKIGQQAVGGPWMTVNEFREKFQGLPPVDGGDELIVPLNVVRGGGPEANPQDAENQFKSEDIDGVLRLAERRE